MEKAAINFNTRRWGMPTVLISAVFLCGALLLPSKLYAQTLAGTIETIACYTTGTGRTTAVTGYAYGTTLPFTSLQVTTTVFPGGLCDPDDPPCSPVTSYPNQVGPSEGGGVNRWVNGHGPDIPPSPQVYVQASATNNYPGTPTQSAWLTGIHTATCSTPPPVVPGVCGPLNGTATINTVPSGAAACSRGGVTTPQPEYNCTGSYYDNDDESSTYGQEVCYQWGTTVIRYYWACTFPQDGVTTPTWCSAPFAGTGCANSADASGNILTTLSGTYTSAPAASKFKYGNYCFGNSGIKNYFVPAKTPGEFNSFWNNVGAGSNLNGLFRIP
jgi:hypothetical protein